MVKSYEKTRLSRQLGDQGEEREQQPGDVNYTGRLDVPRRDEEESGGVHKKKNNLVPANNNNNKCDSLSVLPDELILRIVSLSGNATHQMRSAFALGNTCRRLRRVLLTVYLPSLHKFTRDSLNALGLSNTARATNALLHVLNRTCKIRQLTLEGPPPAVFTAGCFLALSHAAKSNLRVVNLAYSYLTDDCVKPLLENCTALEQLSLRSCSNMTGEAFQGEPSTINAPIKTLDLTNMHLLDVQSLKAVANVPTITSIKLAGCSNVNNNALLALMRGKVRHSIRHINLKYCPVDDESIIELVTECKKLNSLVLAKHHDNLWETGYYTEAAVMYIRERLPSVQVVIEN